MTQAFKPPRRVAVTRTNEIDFKSERRTIHDIVAARKNANAGTANTSLSTRAEKRPPRDVNGDADRDTGHGGKREGAGRPKNDRSVWSVRVTDEEREYLLRALERFRR